MFLRNFLRRQYPQCIHLQQELYRVSPLVSPELSPGLAAALATGFVFFRRSAENLTDIRCRMETA